MTALRAPIENYDIEEARQTIADTLVGPLHVYTDAFVKIRNKEGGLNYFRMNEPQRLLDQRIEDQKARTGRVRMIVPKARQLGVSTYAGARFYRKTTVFEGQRTFILTHEDAATQNLFEMVRAIHDNMDPVVKVPATNDAANSLRFASKRSSYGLGTAKTKARGRSENIQNLHCSEVAFWANAEEHIKGILQAVGAVDHTEVILESTGNGPAGVFYDMTMQALAGKSEYEVCFLPWFSNEAYVARPPHGWKAPAPWRDYARLHDIDQGQLYWAYLKNQELSLSDRADPDDGPCFAFQQEYPSTIDEVFISPAEIGLIDPMTVMEARRRTLPEDENAAHVMGVDIGRGGDDNWLIDRRGRTAGRNVDIRLNTRDTMEVVGLVADRINGLKLDRVFIDVTGIGAGVYDRLVELGYGSLVVPVNFGGKPMQPERYMNKRAEMWGTMAEWLADPAGVSIPDDDLLHAHLTGPKVKYDSHTRVVLEKKEDIKKRLGFSPDGGDALALTFAEPVIRPETTIRNQTVTRELRKYRSTKRRKSGWAF